MMDFKIDLDKIVSTGSTDEKKFKVFDLVKEEDAKKINDVLVLHRLGDYPVAIWLKKDNVSYDFIKRHSYCYLEEKDVYLAYHNVDLPKCEDCLENTFVPEKKIVKDEGIVKE